MKQMGRENDFINIDELFQKGLNDHNHGHKDEVWKKIEDALDKKKKRRILLPWSNSALLIIGSVVLGSGMIATYLHVHNESKMENDVTTTHVTSNQEKNQHKGAKINSAKKGNSPTNTPINAAEKRTVSKNNTANLTNVRNNGHGNKIFASNSTAAHRENDLGKNNLDNNSLTHKSTHKNSNKSLNDNNLKVNLLNKDGKIDPINNGLATANTKPIVHNNNLPKRPDNEIIESSKENVAVKPSEEIGQNVTNPVVKLHEKEYERVDNEWYSRVNDSIKHTVIHEYFTMNNQHKRVFVKSDTTITFEDIIKLEPLTAWESDKIEQLFNYSKLKEKPVMVASNNKATLLREIASKNTGLEDIANYKVSSKSDQHAAHGIVKFMQNMEKSLANLNEGETKLYFGLTAGINTAISSNANLGYQVGLNVGYKINERLSIMAQFNWIRRSFRNYSVKDLFTEYSNASQTELGNGSYRYEADARQNTVIISPSSNNVVFLPITLSYNLSPKLSVYGGLGPAFGFSLKQSVKQTSETNHVSQIGVTNPYASGQSSILVNNGNNNLFGLGYSVGVNYDLNQKWSLNANVQQFFLSGKSTNAYLTETKSLWKQPMVNVGIGFYLGRTQKVVYMMDK